MRLANHCIREKEDILTDQLGTRAVWRWVRSQEDMPSKEVIRIVYLWEALRVSISYSEIDQSSLILEEFAGRKTYPAAW